MQSPSEGEITALSTFTYWTSINPMFRVLNQFLQWQPQRTKNFSASLCTARFCCPMMTKKFVIQVFAYPEVENFQLVSESIILAQNFDWISSADCSDAIGHQGFHYHY